MDVKHRHEVLKCPNPACRNPISISVGRWPGGVNDSGGWVLSCRKCDLAFPIKVKNPDDASSVLSGATILGSWDDEIDNRAEVLKKFDVVEGAAYPERLLVIQHGEPENFYDLKSTPLYRCGVCKTGLEEISYAALGKSFGKTNDAFGGYLNWYLAHSGGRAPEAVTISLDAKCACGEEYRAHFYRPFSEFFPQSIGEFWLIAVEGEVSALDVDGIYTRDDCIALLEKLLLRWRGVHRAVLLAVPFIGFNFPGARKKVPDLWNRLLKYTDPEKTTIITRKAAFTLLKSASKGTEQDVDFLKGWGLLNPTLEALDQKKAVFKTDFHAKIYCGISKDHVETLVGSFNVHQGSYVENIHLLTYSYQDFTKRYLEGMKVDFDNAVLEEPRSVLKMVLENGEIQSFKEVTFFGALSLK